MRINTNITALNTYNNYTSNNSKIGNSVAKLSSGYQINSAADNAAGLAISEKMRAQIRGLDRASENSQDAISLVQTAEGALASSDEILQRMREISVQAASDSNENEIDRVALNDEFSQLQSELDEIAQTTQFNKKTLIDGSYSTSKTSLTTNMATSKLSASVGNTAAGIYNFEVNVETVTSAVAAKSPDELTVDQSSISDYFSSASGVATTIADKSSLFNGDYKITSAVEEDTGNLLLTATGGSDGEQVFTATVDMTADFSTSNAITANFSDGTNTFSTTFTFQDSSVNSATANFYQKDLSAATPQDVKQDVTNLSTSINESGMKFTIGGGVDAVKEVKEVQASLTGAKNITLKAGDTSVTFDNGVSVYFDELSAADLDTKANGAYLGDEGVIGVTGDGTGTASAFDSAAVTFGSGEDTPATGVYTLTTTDMYALGAGTAATTTVGAVSAHGGTEVVTDDLAVTLAKGDEDGSFTLTSADGKVYTAGAAAVAAIENSTESTDAASDVTFTAEDGKTLVLSTFIAGKSGGINGEASDALDIAVTNGGTITFAKGAASGYTVTASNGTESYTTDIHTAASIEADTVDASSDEVFEFKNAAGNTAMTVTATTGTVGLTATNVDTAIEALSFNVKGNFNHQDIFGTTESKITATKTDNAGLTFQVGANEGDELVLNLDRMDSEYLGVNGSSVLSQESASKAITQVDDAINQVSSMRSYLGAIQNRIEYKMDNLSTASQNLTSAESQIRDVDMAKEMTSFTNANIMQQAATAMLAQANSLPQNVLSLIG